jgi:hypothetical protein
VRYIVHLWQARFPRGLPHHLMETCCRDQLQMPRKATSPSYELALSLRPLPAATWNPPPVVCWLLKANGERLTGLIRCQNAPSPAPWNQAFSARKATRPWMRSMNSRTSSGATFTTSPPGQTRRGDLRTIVQLREDREALQRRVGELEAEVA